MFLERTGSPTRTAGAAANPLKEKLGDLLL